MELSRDLVVNPNTVARTYTELEREGLLVSRPGRGVFVAQPQNDLTRVARDRRVTEQLDVSVSTDIGPEINNAIFCMDPKGNEIGRASAGTNHVGYPGQHEAWRLSTLITADMKTL